ncbi:hypothetical protein [Dactylosporangium sp. CA-233914]|uniref:hypothetical protein n=1 Tax=Dactylosporangium sp. CA-233914 TaxID=3239934 RepID=UPI003D8E1036
MRIVDARGGGYCRDVPGRRTGPLGTELLGRDAEPAGLGALFAGGGDGDEPAGAAVVLTGRGRSPRRRAWWLSRRGSSTVNRVSPGSELTRMSPWCFLTEPGIGKSALLEAARELARAAGFRTLGAIGVDAEAQLCRTPVSTSSCDR